MTFKFDHLVHFVGSPEEARESLKQHGLHVVNGGRHEHGGTYNTLSYFDLSYLELIGLVDKSLAEESAEKYSLRDTFKKDNYAIGLSRIALRSLDLEMEAERFKSLGLEVFGPFPLSRQRPDGSVVSWKLLFAGRENEELELPFFIQWDDSDDERKADLVEQKTIAPHPKGDLQLSSIGFAVQKLDTTVEKWSNYLDLEKGESFVDESLNAKGQKLKLTGGDIAFYSPIADGLVAETLAERGEKPFLVDITGAREKEQFEVKNALYRFI
ncbi:VOC family protein [Oceanobacillus alkalisoli]|uniref:VOC family protein n=1 Tax=Oceanobacillus alkalisoli TaxID=2925113 RepID=UPI001F1198AA|nr:VOC family protein [Oceanobacillus alkalisoli]MCF3944546.1 VOC family protein [Oceanobacillus alkalisoli]